MTVTPLFQAYIQGHNKGVSSVYLFKDCPGNMPNTHLLQTWNLAWSTSWLQLKINKTDGKQ